MITYKDIRVAINKMLLKTGKPVNSQDVAKGFKRPSFFLQLDNNVRSSTESQVHKSLMVHIYYFPSDRYDYAIEVLEMQELLEEMFDMKLAVNDRLLNINEQTTFLNDGVLNCTFDLEFEYARGRNKYEPPSEMMEELHFEKVEE